MIHTSNFYSLFLTEYKENGSDKTCHTYLQLKVLKQINEVRIQAQLRFLSKDDREGKQQLILLLSDAF